VIYLLTLERLKTKAGYKARRPMRHLTLDHMEGLNLVLTQEPGVILALCGKTFDIDRMISHMLFDKKADRHLVCYNCWAVYHKLFPTRQSPKV
jgi:hypothetical protein